MDKNIITVNIGSRSKKYGYFRGLEEICKSEFGVGDEESFFKFLSDNGIDAKNSLVAVRIVAPGRFFVDHRKMDADYLSKLKESAEIAPIHAGSVIREIELILGRLEGVKIYAVSDSTFHKGIPEYAKVYAIPEGLRENHGIERQGYHGLSLSSAVSRIEKKCGYLPEKVIICHLGGGSSVSAVKDGVSVDTSMGWTPLEGLPMTERVGDIDPGAITFLSEVLGKRGKKMEQFLSKECGLEAVSSVESGDVVRLIDEEEKGNKKASLALDFYAYKIRRYIGAMSAALGGCDMLVFTGMVGLRSWQVRERVVKNLEYLNLDMDMEKNKVMYEPQNVEFLGRGGYEKNIALVPVNEALEMVKAVFGRDNL